MRAMILAAGRGKRLRPLTDGCPKPLIKVNQKALIVYHIEALKKAGFEDIVINVCHLGEQIIQTLGDGSKFGVNLQYSDETGECLGTGGGIKRALPLLRHEPFVLVNGDIFCDYPFERLKAPTMQGHLVLVPNPKHHPHGDFTLDKNFIKTRQPNRLAHTYAGIGVFQPSFFDTCQSDVIPLPPLFFQAILNEMLSGEIYDGFWVDVGNLERLKALEDMLSEPASLKRANQ